MSQHALQQPSPMTAIYFTFSYVPLRYAALLPATHLARGRIAESKCALKREDQSSSTCFSATTSIDSGVLGTNGSFCHPCRVHLLRVSAGCLQLSPESHHHVCLDAVRAREEHKYARLDSRRRVIGCLPLDSPPVQQEQMSILPSRSYRLGVGEPRIAGKEFYEHIFKSSSCGCTSQ